MMTLPVSRLSGCGPDPHQSPTGIKASAAELAFAPKIISSFRKPSVPGDINQDDTVATEEVIRSRGPRSKN
jgi:hypothetical protein